MMIRLSLLFLVAILSLLIAPFVGATSIPLTALVGGGDEMSRTILWELRIPRVLLSAFTGGALAIAGLSFQMLFRNPLATPYTLGVSNGAAFAVSLTLVALGGGHRTSSALIGATFALLFIVLIARTAGRLGATTILLAGVVLSFFFASLTVLVQYLSNESQLMRMTRWLMGSIETPPVGVLLPLGIATGIALAINLLRARELLLLSFGEEFAITHGVSPQRETLLLFGANAILIGIVVSVTGPIGFIGIIAPYIIRASLGMEPRTLVVGSFLLGSALLTACDAVGRAVAAPFELPAGVITALVGAPVFLGLLMRKPQQFQPG